MTNSHIWLPNKNIIENIRGEIQFSGPRVGGRFKIEALLPDGRRYEKSPWQDNLITNAGLNRWGTGAVVSHCSVGGGSTAATVDDTALASFIASANSGSGSISASASSPYYGARTYTCSFSPPGGSGHNVAEVGLAWASGGGSLFTRAVISPSTITWAPAETLVVTYEIRNYPPLSDSVQSGDLTIKGVITPTTFTIRAAKAGDATYWTPPCGTFIKFNELGAGNTNWPPEAYTGGIGSLTGVPSGTRYTGAWLTLDAYSSGSYRRTSTMRWSTSQGNASLRSFVIYSNNGPYQMEISPVIVKTNLDTLVLNVSSYVWGRY